MITYTQCFLYNCVYAWACVWGEKYEKLTHTHKSHSSSTPHFLEPPLPHLKSAYYFILHKVKLFLVIFFIIFLRCKMIFCIPWTGWWFSFTYIFGIYILNMYLPWQKRSVPYLKFGVWFKSVMQNYVCWFPPTTNTPLPTTVPHISLSPPCNNNFKLKQLEILSI